MSKIGKINIPIPEKVKVLLTGSTVNVEGPLGKQSIKLQSPLTNITGAMTQIFSGLIYGVTAATVAKALPIPGKMKP